MAIRTNKNYIIFRKTQIKRLCFLKKKIIGIFFFKFEYRAFLRVTEKKT